MNKVAEEANQPLDPAFKPNQWRLALAQLCSGVGIASGIAVGAVLVEQISGSTDLAGLAQTSTILGAGLLAFPMARIAFRSGRRLALTMGFGLGALGAVFVLAGVQLRLTPLMFLGLMLFGSATAAGLQSRYAATDLAPPHLRATAMSVVVWATTVGSVAGPHLSAPGAKLGQKFGLNDLVGPYLFSLTAFVLATLIVMTLKRPSVQVSSDRSTPRQISMLNCLRIAWNHPMATLGMVAVVTGQMMMSSVMVMTPLHMHHHDMGIEIVGIVISSHILGMYGLSPVVGWLTDKWGPRKVIVVGMAIFLMAFIGGILDAMGQSHLSRLIPSLVLLGVGWSCTLIAGSTLVAQTVEADVKVPMQGTVDTFMNFGAAAITSFSGVVLRLWGFVGINLMATVVLVFLGLVLLRSRVLPDEVETFDEKAAAQAD